MYCDSLKCNFIGNTGAKGLAKALTKTSSLRTLEYVMLPVVCARVVVSFHRALCDHAGRGTRILSQEQKPPTRSSISWQSQVPLLERELVLCEFSSPARMVSDSFEVEKGRCACETRSRYRKIP